jgi:hypothetical protein
MQQTVIFQNLNNEKRDDLKLVEDPAFELFRPAVVVIFSGKSRRIQLSLYLR